MSHRQACRQDLENSRSCRQGWKIQYLAGKIWKIQDLATHHSLPHCSNSRRITHQLAGPFLAGVTFFSFCFYPYLKRIKVLDIQTCQRRRIAPPPPSTGRYSHKFRIGLCRPESFKNLDDPNLPPQGPNLKNETQFKGNKTKNFMETHKS